MMKKHFWWPLAFMVLGCSSTERNLASGGPKGWEAPAPRQIVGGLPEGAVIEGFSKHRDSVFKKEKIYSFQFSLKLKSSSGVNLGHQVEVRVRSVDDRVYPVYGTLPSWTTTDGHLHTDRFGQARVRWSSHVPNAKFFVKLTQTTRGDVSDKLSQDVREDKDSREFILVPEKPISRKLDLSAHRESKDEDIVFIVPESLYIDYGYQGPKGDSHW